MCFTLIYHVFIKDEKNDEPDDADEPFWNDKSIWKRISKPISVHRTSIPELQSVIPDDEAASKVHLFVSCYTLVI